jgi:hypothetical protein
VLVRKYRKREIDQEYEGDRGMKEVSKESRFEPANCRVDDHSGRDQYSSRSDMHPSHARDKLGASENHASATEDVVDQVENDKDTVSISSVSDPNKLERCMSVRNSQLGYDAQDGHQGDLEGESARPPDRQSNTPAVCVGRGDDTLVNPPAPGVSGLYLGVVLEGAGVRNTYIQLEKTAEQVNPVPTERLATMNISD